MIATRRLNDEQDSHCIVRGNRLPVLTARMQDCEEMTNCIFNAFLLCVSIETRDSSVNNNALCAVDRDSWNICSKSGFEPGTSRSTVHSIITTIIYYRCIISIVGDRQILEPPITDYKSTATCSTSIGTNQTRVFEDEIENARCNCSWCRRQTCQTNHINVGQLGYQADNWHASEIDTTSYMFQGCIGV